MWYKCATPIMLNEDTLPATKILKNTASSVLYFECSNELGNDLTKPLQGNQ